MRLLGGGGLWSGAEPVAGPPAQRHRIALLALLAAQWPRPVSRDRAMALLWPERPIHSARRLLNLAVYVLREALGDGAITSTMDGLLLDPAVVRCDLLAFRAAAREGRYGDAIEGHAGAFLDGFFLPESPEFGHWLDEQRAEITGSYVSALLAEAERQERNGDHRGRVATCRRLVATDPHSAPFALRLMRALAAAGEMDAARQHALQHAARRRADLGLPPDPAVAALAAQLGADPGRIEVRGTTGRPSRPTIAVLPFRNLGADPGDQCFADGLTEDVVTQLMRARQLRVLSRAGTAPCTAPRDGGAAPEAGREAVLRLVGSVRRSGRQVRVVVQLFGRDPERVVWGESFDRRVGEPLALQREIAESVANAVAEVLTAEERGRPRPSGADRRLAS